MYRVYGHTVEKVGSSPSSIEEGLRFAHRNYKPLRSAYVKPSVAKRTIYDALKSEFKNDAIAYGVTGHNCSYFTFEACFEWGYITVYPTRRVAGFWSDTPVADRLVTVLP